MKREKNAVKVLPTKRLLRLTRKSVRQKIDVGWKQTKAGKRLTLKEVRDELSELKKEWARNR